jgi:hypothetical protein
MDQQDFFVYSEEWTLGDLERERSVFAAAVSINGDERDAKFFTGHRDIEEHVLTELETFRLIERAELVAQSADPQKYQVFATYNRDTHTTSLAIVLFSNSEEMPDLKDMYAIVSERVREAKNVKSPNGLGGYDTEFIDAVVEAAERVEGEERSIAYALAAKEEKLIGSDGFQEVDYSGDNVVASLIDYDNVDVEDGTRFIGCALTMDGSTVTDSLLGVGVRPGSMRKGAYSEMIGVLADETLKNKKNEGVVTACMVIDTKAPWSRIALFKGEHPGGLEGAFEHAVLVTMWDEITARRKAEMIDRVAKHMELVREKKRIFG